MIRIALVLVAGVFVVAVIVIRNEAKQAVERGSQRDVAWAETTDLRQHIATAQVFCSAVARMQCGSSREDFAEWERECRHGSTR